MRPLKLTYHQAAFDLINRIPFLDPNAVELIRQHEQAGLLLPAALREWYSLAGAVELLGSMGDHPTSLQNILAFLPTLPAVSEGKSAHSEITILVEHAGNFACSVHLNGDDDPPVVMEIEEAEDKDKPDTVLWPHFSEFIFQWCWEHLDLIFCPVRKIMTRAELRNDRCMLCASEDELRDEDLRYLRTLFPLEHNTQGNPQFYHFQNQDSHIYIWCRKPDDVWWWLRADGESRLLQLARSVWAVGTLSKTLIGPPPWSSPCADSVLQSIIDT
jgi:hypothetical protein